MTYDTFVQTVKRKSNPSFTCVLNGIFLLTALTESKKEFYVKKDTGYDIFKSNKNFKFINIEKNKKFQCLNKVYAENLNQDYPSYIDGGNVSAYRSTHELGDGGRSKNIYSLNYYNDIIKRKDENFKKYIRDVTEKEINSNNIITDRSSGLIHYNLYGDDNIVYDKKSDLKNKLELKTKINLNEEKIQSFDKNHYFICIPSFKMKNNEYFYYIDKLIRLIYEKTPYQNLILLSGSNEDKEYCFKKFNIKTTEHYDVISKKKYNTGTKHKSNFSSIIKDILYVQNSHAKLLDLRSLIKLFINSSDLQYHHVYKQWYKPASFNKCCVLAKEYNIIDLA
jgi:hypothetical protein